MAHTAGVFQIYKLPYDGHTYDSPYKYQKGKDIYRVPWACRAYGCLYGFLVSAEAEQKAYG